MFIGSSLQQNFKSLEGYYFSSASKMGKPQTENEIQQNEQTTIIVRLKLNGQLYIAHQTANIFK